MLLPLLLLACTEGTYYPPPPAAPDSGPVFSAGTGPSTPTEPSTLPCSADLGGPADLVVTNGTGTAITLHWRDWNCVETPYHVLGPGEAATQGTFVGHVWLARTADGTYVDHLTLDAEGTTRWTVQ